MEILVVCSGNICRSPYAAGYLRFRLQSLGENGHGVDSAGTLGIMGSPPSPETLQVAQESGFELKEHRSKGVTFEGVDEADVILVMEDLHRSELAQRYPEDQDKIHLLSEFHPAIKEPSRAPDIFDPIGLPLEEYRRCFSLVRDAVDGYLTSGYLQRD